MGQYNIYQDGTYFKKHPTWDEEDSSWKAKQITKILNKNSITPITICEVGCGAGEILSCLARETGDDVSFYGYDISPQAIEICKRKETQNVHFFLKDALAEGEITFDVAMAIDVFEHVEDYFGFLRKFIHKGKYKIFHIPLDLFVLNVLRSSPIINTRSDYGHIHYFTKETALATLKDTGYEVVDYFYTRGSLEIPKRTRPGWKTILLDSFRRLFFSLNQDLAVRILGGFSLLVLAK